MPRSPSFRLHSKNILLTYPQCSIPMFILLESLKELFPDKPPYYVRVSSETHEDGSLHRRCLLQFEYKFETQNQSFFDISHGGRSFHPNAQGARNAAAVDEFISKYGEFVASGTFRGGKTSPKSQHEIYSKILSTARDKDQFLSMVKEQDPKWFFRYKNNVKYAAEALFPYVSEFTYFPKCPKPLLEWAYSSLGIGPYSGPLDMRPMSLIIEGETKTGKTQWARSLGPHNYYAGPGRMDLRNHRDDVMYNVIDEVDPKFVKYLNFFIGSKTDLTADVRHGKPRMIKGGIPCIVICTNASSYSTYFSKDPAFLEYIRANASYVCIRDNKLF